jgi:starvation-inducible DNA-binding protein
MVSSGELLATRRTIPCLVAMVSSPPIDIGIPADRRAQIAQGLGRVLADSTVLYAKTHGFHWNVTGPMFNTLHLMFMEQYTELWTALDEIAERIRALGHMAPFGGSTYRDLSTIPETNGVPPAMAMVRELVEGHEAVARTIRGVFELADGANDQPTADLLTQRLQIHEKTAWMLRSLLEG